MDWWLLLACICLGFFWSSPGCCCTDCDICSDSFDRADDTDIDTGSTCGWTEVAGDFSIASNKLSIAATNAIATCDTTNPDATAFTSITVTVRATNSGDLARVLLNYQDSNNFYFAEWKAGAAGNIIIYRKSGGVIGSALATATFATSTGTDYVWTTCIALNGVMSSSMNVTGTIHHADASGVTGSNAAFGLGTGATCAGTITFDNFSAKKVTEDCPTCPLYCSAGLCDGGYGPSRFQLDFSAITDGSCTTCDTDIARVVITDKYTTCNWFYNHNNPCAAWVNPTVGYQLLMSSSGSDVVMTSNIFGAPAGPDVKKTWTATVCSGCISGGLSSYDCSNATETLSLVVSGEASCTWPATIPVTAIP